MRKGKAQKRGRGKKVAEVDAKKGRQAGKVDNELSDSENGAEPIPSTSKAVRGVGS